VQYSVFGTSADVGSPAKPQSNSFATIGVTEVEVVYHRPAVKNRKVWGELVPYNGVWRAGANENTTISFSDPVKSARKSSSGRNLWTSYDPDREHMDDHLQ